MAPTPAALDEAADVRSTPIIVFMIIVVAFVMDGGGVVVAFVIRDRAGSSSTAAAASVWQPLRSEQYSFFTTKLNRASTPLAYTTRYNFPASAPARSVECCSPRDHTKRVVPEVLLFSMSRAAYLCGCRAEKLMWLPSTTPCKRYTII